MKKLRLLSWNVNGIRACFKKGFENWFHKEEFDILGIQETKAWEEQLSDEQKHIDEYESYFSKAQKKGYSGVALYTKLKPKKVDYSFGAKEFDSEGRVIRADYGDFIFYTIYFPNGQARKERLDYKMAFYEAFLEKMKEELKAGLKIIVCGDVNTAHHPIDLARPKDNEKTSGFLPMEREWMDRFEQAGFIDSFRVFNKEPDNYTWWSMRTKARERNVGWRIDYFYVSENLKENLKSAFILSDVEGSDHCPIGIEIEI